MAKIEIYKCDKCETEKLDGQGDMKYVSIVVSKDNVNRYNLMHQAIGTKLWCGKCLDKYQMMSGCTKLDKIIADSASKKELTLGEKIEELIGEMVSESLDNN